MRKPAYLSPTSIKKFYDDTEGYYIDYLAEAHPPRMPQTEPMSIGSAFDAYVKSYLHQRLFGKSDPAFELRTIFETQVEEHLWDWAWKAGAFAFEVYKKYGALADIALELESAIGTPRFEGTLQGVVTCKDAVSGKIKDVVFLGKPDLFYINKVGVFVILDWKVNGFCSKWGASPRPGYVDLLTEQGRKGCHKKAQVMMHEGLKINVAQRLEDIEKDWAAQTAIYSWLAGADIGEEFLVCIDQLACKPCGMDYPNIRVAQHRTRVGQPFQTELFGKAARMWEIIQSDYIFRDLSKAESQLKCKDLDRKAEVLHEMRTSGSENDKMFLEISGEDRKW
jgi:hypothetical protein